MDRTSRHTSLRTQCGICRQILLPGVYFIPLFGDDLDSVSGNYLDHAVYFGRHSKNITVCGKYLCWKANCYRCADAPEAVALHPVCFGILQAHCKVDHAIDRLWTTAGQRNLWKDAPVLQLDRESEVDVDLVRENSEMSGVRLLGRLPAELIQMIHKYSESAEFWRCISAMSLARELSQVKTDVAMKATTSMPLCNILAWARGDSIVVCSEKIPRFIRLTLDSRGIRKIERFQEIQSYEPARSNKEAFVVASESEFKDVVAIPKFNVLRLELPNHIRGFQIWDTPSPPRLEDCKFYGRISQSMQLRTIDLCAVTGLTFFFSHSKLYTVHAHTRSNPYVTDTWRRLSERRRPKVLSVYLPIPQGEEITAIAIRLRNSLEGGQSTAQKASFLFRTKLAGDVTIGPHQSGVHSDFVLSQSSPKLFIYSSSEIGPATVFGTYPRGQHDGAISPSFAHPWSSGDPPMHDLANMSSAPLKGVICVQVLENEDRRCYGMLLKYDNGAQRALGDYRRGNHRRSTDCVKQYREPSRICYLSHKVLGPVVKASNHHGHDRDHDQAGWTCNSLSGVLEFWFSRNQSIIRIVE